MFVVCLGRQVGLAELWPHWASKEGWANRRPLLPAHLHALSLAGVGKSSLLLRFADNTFSGESSLGAVGVLWFSNPYPVPESRCFCLMGEIVILVVG